MGEGTMPIYEYILLALLTSGGNAPEGITLTLGPEAIAQPNGGELRIAQKLTTPKVDVPLPKLPKLNKPGPGKFDKGKGSPLLLDKPVADKKNGMGGANAGGPTIGNFSKDKK